MSIDRVRKAGLEPARLLGATPSRWCVCQFHHFRVFRLGYWSGTIYTTSSDKASDLEGAGSFYS